MHVKAEFPRETGRKGEFVRQPSAFREKVSADGSWSQGYIGPVYTTSMNLTILQLPNAALPIYQR